MQIEQCLVELHIPQYTQGEGQWPSGGVDFSEPGGPGFDSSSRQP